MNQATLLFLLEDNRVLLAMKKRGFGVGRWNGVGGKPNDKNELITDTAVRECQEEIGVTPHNIKEMATLNFYFPDGKKQWEQQVIVYTCTKWDGKPAESEEMAPKWYEIDKIPYSEMWADDQYWLPEVLDGKYVKADFDFDENDNLLKQKVEVLT